MKLIQELFQLNEGSKDDGRISILPATSAIFNKSKVDLNAIGQQWPKGTVYVAEKDGDNLVFLYSSGSLGSKFGMGKTFRGKHDQTSKDLGEFEIVNIIKLNGKTENDIDVESENDIATKIKLPLYVFK